MTAALQFVDTACPWVDADLDWCQGANSLGQGCASAVGQGGTIMAGDKYNALLAGHGPPLLQNTIVGNISAVSHGTGAATVNVSQ